MIITMATPKAKKKERSLDHYARAIRDDIATLGEKMDFGFAKVHKQMRDIREDLKRFNEAMVSKADLEETIRRELDKSPYAKESDLNDLRTRVVRLEEKLGLAPRHHALS